MPPPSLRCSPSRDSRPRHKKGQSLEGGLSFKEKDDDLALFNEVQSKEQEIFLLQSMDDLEDILSTNLKPLGITIPARGEVSDLLNVVEDKNDYEWLLTPPDTPLFPSLDDEQIPVNLVHNGRPRSRRSSISGSPTLEKGYNSRGSASPQHLSPSPRSSVSSAFQSRGRTSSAQRSSPTPSSRHSTPTRRSPGPSVKPSTPPFRSSTPTPRRISTGSGVGFSSGVRGASPVSSSRGSSSSPKIRAWQSNIPGFSLEAPPNLCTSLADRPSSFVRGSSPASKNSRNSSPMVRRQSMSPTATRRINSPHRHERDRFNSHSKGSVDSSGYDDADSFLSGNGGLSSNRSITFSKKPSKVVTPSSAPKRSFDTAIRHMDRRTPQNMFRPLLSSVPTTTFHGDKATSSHYTMESMNSSVTTSSNASSDQAAIGAPDIEGSEHNQYDMASKFAKIPNIHDLNGEIFSFDKMDKFHEDTLEIYDQSPDMLERYKIIMESGGFKDTRSEKKDGGRGLEVAMRVLAAALTVAAAIVMGVNKQEVDIGLGPFSIPATAKSSYMSAFVFVVVANSIASVVALLTLLTGHRPNTLKTVADVAMVALLFSATGSGGAVGVLGYKGNSHVLWNAVCDQFGKFCHNVLASLTLSFVAAIVYLLLVLLTFHKLRRN